MHLLCKEEAEKQSSAPSLKLINQKMYALPVEGKESATLGFLVPHENTQPEKNENAPSPTLGNVQLSQIPQEGKPGKVPK